MLPYFHEIKISLYSWLKKAPTSCGSKMFTSTQRMHGNTASYNSFSVPYYLISLPALAQREMDGPC